MFTVSLAEGDAGSTGGTSPARSRTGGYSALQAHRDCGPRVRAPCGGPSTWRTPPPPHSSSHAREREVMVSV